MVVGVGLGVQLIEFDLGTVILWVLMLFGVWLGVGSVVGLGLGLQLVEFDLGVSFRVLGPGSTDATVHGWRSD